MTRERLREWVADKVVSRVWWWWQLLVCGPNALVNEAEEQGYEQGRIKGHHEGFDEAMRLLEDGARAQVELEAALIRARAQMEDEE